MSYNILNYPNVASIDSILVADTTSRNPYFRTTISSVDADIIVIEEIERRVDAEAFLSNVINASGETYALGFEGGSDDDNAIYYKTDKFEYISGFIVHNMGGQGSHTTVEYRLYHKVTLDTLVIFATHLQAFEDSLGFARRIIEASAIRERTNAFPPGTYFIAIGDFNTYYGTESGFQILVEDISSSTGYFIDPLNLQDYTDWSGIPELYEIHSWATRNGNGDYLGGGSKSGLNQRLDLLLNSKSVVDPGGVTYKTGSFVTYGNDGLHNNIDINDIGSTGLPNQAVSQTIADALYYASDHLPVYADFYFGSSDVGSPLPASIVFTQVGADDPEVIEFITLANMDLTKLKITNSEVNVNGDLVNGDGTFDLSKTTWTDVPGGTFVRLGSNLTNDNNASDRILAYDGTGSTVPTLSTGKKGEQLIAYTGSSANPTYIAGITWGTKDGWLPKGQSNSYAPGTLSDVALKDKDNYYYEKSVDGDSTKIRLALLKKKDWKGDNNRFGYKELTSKIGNSALPVELAFFAATLNANNVELRWRTESEVNNYGFDIERYKENMEWNKIGFVEGQGNSNAPKQYNFSDTDINQSGNYYYRLKQIDNDGTYDYS
ncbi:MAG: hypothetical protein O6940_02150, partial [Ignavibacteria bacterium]|nr:hypothetical protein [Ignavibacteria bacterium]